MDKILSAFNSAFQGKLNSWVAICFVCVARQCQINCSFVDITFSYSLDDLYTAPK